MTNNELYLAISQLVNNNSKELEYRMDTMEKSLRDEMHIMNDRINVMDDKINVMDDKINAMDDKISVMNDRINVIDNRINNMSNVITNIQLKLENIIEPRLQNIEACYTSTFERYSINVEKFDRMQLDIDVMKSVVRKHEEILCPQPA